MPTSLEPTATPSSPQFLATAASVPTEETEKKEEEEQVEKKEEQVVEEETNLVTSPINVTKDYCTVVLDGSGGPVIPVWMRMFDWKKATVAYFMIDTSTQWCYSMSSVN